jgi:allantoinase
VVWTEARRRGFSLGDVVSWMAERPARLAGLRRKGQIAPGYDADCCVFAPDEAFTVDPARPRGRLLARDGAGPGAPDPDLKEAAE